MQGDLAAAEAEVRDYSGSPGLMPEWTWRFRLLEGEILELKGLSLDVVSLLQVPPPAELALTDLGVRRHMLLGLAYSAVSRLPEANQELAEAEAVCERLHCESAGELAQARGVVEIRQGHLGPSERAFRKGLEAARQQGDRFLRATVLLNLGVLAMRRGQYDDFIDWSNAANSIFHDLGARMDEEKILGNIGWAYYKLGDPEQSIAYTQEAERKTAELGIVVDQIRWLYNLGVVYYARNQLSLAEDYFRRSLDLAIKVENTEQTKDILSSLAFASLQQGRLEDAERYNQQVFDLASRSGDRVMELYALLSKGEILAQRKDPGRVEPLFLEVIRDKKSDPSLRWQAQNDLARVYERTGDARLADTQYRAAIATLECTRSSVRREELRLPFLGNGAEIYDDYMRFLITQGRGEEALQAADYSRAQTLAEGLGLLQSGNHCGAPTRTAINPQQVAKAAGGPALFYWLGPRQSYLWVVTSKKTVLITLPAEREIEALVQNYRKALLDPPDVLQARNADGFKLYDTLVRPAQKLVPVGSRVTIIADGVLNNLNFETLLVSGSKPHFWIEDVTLTNASSLRMLEASHSSLRPGGKLLMIGDPVIPDPKFPALPSALTEMRNVEKHFPASDRQVFSGSAASPAAFLNSRTGTFSYLHFVAHGTASQLSPLDSAVILSKATAEEDSYKLHARDIIAHPFHANLVVVSTCYGSGTTLYNGEGLVGLSWAFLRAGAHDVIGALWQVSDASTPQLMDQLYGELRKGRSPQDALRAAKLSLLHSDGPFRKPFYWAPFQLYTGS